MIYFIVHGPTCVKPIRYATLLYYIKAVTDITEPVYGRLSLRGKGSNLSSFLWYKHIPQPDASPSAQAENAELQPIVNAGSNQSQP